MSGFGKKEKGNKLYSMFIMRKFGGKWDFGFLYGLFECYGFGFVNVLLKGVVDGFVRTCTRIYGLNDNRQRTAYRRS